MGIPSVFRTGITGMSAARAAIATAGHNISNANTPGYSRQKVETTPMQPEPLGGGRAGYLGRGAEISNISRINDEYIDKQIRNSEKDLAFLEEKQSHLRQVEDIFNELHGEGLHRLIARFFNEFRKLSTEPENEALRQSLRESSLAVTRDINRLRNEVLDVARHIDARVEGYTREMNELSTELKDLNLQIRLLEVGGGKANDLQDRREVALKKLTSYINLQSHKDNKGDIICEMPGVGPLVVGPEAQYFNVQRTPADNQGKIENAYDLSMSGNIQSNITHQIKGGKLGALLEVRDQTVSSILGQLDELAYALVEEVNFAHRQGFDHYGQSGVDFFKPLDTQKGAAEFISLSDELMQDVNHIATAAVPDAPGDNRTALAIAKIQNQKMFRNGQMSFDELYDSMVTEIGVLSQRTRSGMIQQKEVVTQLGKIREQISGVSIDEETANLMQFQHAFDASARVIQIADDMLKTVLEMRR